MARQCDNMASNCPPNKELNGTVLSFKISWTRRSLYCTRLRLLVSKWYVFMRGNVSKIIRDFYRVKGFTERKIIE